MDNEMRAILWRNIIITVLLLAAPVALALMLFMFGHMLPVWGCWIVGFFNVASGLAMLLAVLGLWNLHRKIPFVDRYF